VYEIMRLRVGCGVKGVSVCLKWGVKPEAYAWQNALVEQRTTMA
jgi:hypothetical protein